MNKALMLTIFLLFVSILICSLLISCNKDEDSKDDSPTVDDDDDDDDDSLDDDDDDDDDADECGQGLWGFVEDRFDAEDVVAYVYADYEGDDSDGTMEHPFKFIGQALDYAYDNSMDGVAVTDGTYNEQIITETSYSSMKIIGRCPDQVTIEMDSGNAIYLYHQNIVFSHFYILSYGTVAIGSYGQNGIVENNVIEMDAWTSGWGIIVDVSGTIRNNTIIGLGLGGIIADNPTGEVIISGNNLSSKGKGLVHVFGIAADGAADIQIDSNILSDLVGYGILVQDETNGSITDNTLTDVSEVGIIMIGSYGMIERNKISWEVAGSDDTLYGDGIVTYDSSDVSVVENEVQNARRAGVILDATEGVCEANELSDNYYGLVIQNQSTVTQDSNTLEGNEIDLLEDPDRLLDIPESGFDF